MKRAFWTSFFVLLICLPISAQNFQAGITAYGAYDVQGFDTIGLENGNLVIDIPLVSYPQKGTLPSVGYSLVANAPDWIQNCATDDEGNTNCDWSIDPYARFGPQAVPDNELWKTTCSGCDPYGIWQSVVDSTGAGHSEAPLDDTYQTYLATDASGYKLNITPSGGNVTITETDRNGVSHNGSTWKDPSGNTVAVLSGGGGYAGEGGYTDSFGRSIPAPPGTCAPVGLCGSYATGCYENGYPTVSGGTTDLTFCFGTITYSPTIGTQDDPSEQCTITDPGSAQVNVLQSVSLPNGTSWQFSYDSNGDIQTITTPTGATVTYGWESQPGGTQCGYDGEGFNRWVQTRTVNGKTWNYSYTESFSPATVTDPDGNYTVWNFTNGPQGEIQYYDSSSNLLKTVTTTYFTFYNSYSYSYAFDTTLPELVTTAWPNGNVSASCTIWDQNTNTSCAAGSDGLSSSAGIFYYPATYIHVPIIYGSQLYQYEYNYGSGSYGGTLRKTVNSYEWQANSSYQTANLLNLPSSVQVLDGGGTQQGYVYYNYDEGFSYTGCSPGPCGNQTSVHRLLSNGSATATANCRVSVASGGYVVSYKAYNSAGQVTSSVDSCGSSATDATHMTTYGYSSSCYAGTGPTSVTNPLGQTTSFCYDLNTGLLASTTDPNNQTSTQNYDSSRRLTSISYPDGGGVNYSYTDSTPPYFVFTKKITSSMNFTEQGNLDALGRLIRTITSVPASTCSGGYVYVDTTYDDLGRTGSVSNPYCTTSDPTYGIIQYQYDPLNRTTKVIDQDGSATTTTYSGFPCVITTDEAGKSREGCTNGIGQLTDVYEDPNGLNQHTAYSYNVFDNLTGVTQVGSHQRSFSYDSLDRLTSSLDPETNANGTSTTYSYDADGNNLTRTDARGITATYSYDTLSRLTRKAYSDSTPAADFTYDVSPSWGLGGETNLVGRLVEAKAEYVADNVNSYDAVGRVVRQWQQTPVNAPGGYFVYQTYDLAGDLTSATDAAGITISYATDTAGHVSTVTSSLVDAAHPAALWTTDSALGYYPNGAVRKATFGNGLTEANVYQPRLQPCRLNLNSSNTFISDCFASISGTVQDLEYAYGGWGSTNNGNVTAFVGGGTQVFNRSYGYDSLNRLQSMSAPWDQCTGLSWNYDAWGNRNVQNVTGGTCPSFNETADSNNHLPAPYQYDAAGNMTHDASHSYAYDAENHIVSVDGGSTAKYVYDALGKRVERANSDGTFDEFYDFSGNMTAEWENIPNYNNWGAYWAYLGSRLLVQYSNGTTFFARTDQLGSIRLVTDLGDNVCETIDYSPFGETNFSGTGECWSSFQFTGKELDGESGLYNFEAREDSPAMGRFMSPDPLAGHTEDPQTLNKYSYVRNNPLTLTDPTGMDFYLSCSRPGNDCAPNPNGDGELVEGQIVGSGYGAQFVPTQISSNSDGDLVDQYGNRYTAAVSGSGVSFTEVGSNQPAAQGYFFGTNPTMIKDAADFPGFTFNFTYADLKAGVNAGGTFSYDGTASAAEAVLQAGGFKSYWGDNFNPFHSSTLDYETENFRTPGATGTGLGSGHVIVHRPQIVVDVGMLIPSPIVTVPTAGDLHLGEANPYNGGLAEHAREVYNWLLGN